MNLTQYETQARFVTTPEERKIIIERLEEFRIKIENRCKENSDMIISTEGSPRRLNSFTSKKVTTTKESDNTGGSIFFHRIVLDTKAGTPNNLKLNGGLQ